MKEIVNYSNAAKMLSLELDMVMDIKVPNLQEERVLLIYKKITAIPQRYPRRPGIPQKRPVL
jgi:16S rRNA (guanine527-N7)-methyltransferase